MPCDSTMVTMATIHDSPPSPCSAGSTLFLRHSGEDCPSPPGPGLVLELGDHTPDLREEGGWGEGGQEGGRRRGRME